MAGKIPARSWVVAPPTPSLITTANQKSITTAMQPATTDFLIIRVAASFELMLERMILAKYYEVLNSNSGASRFKYFINERIGVFLNFQQIESIRKCCNVEFADWLLYF